MEIQHVAKFLEGLEGEGTLMVQFGEGEPRPVVGVRLQHDLDPKTGQNKTQVILRTERPKVSELEKLKRDKAEAERKVKEPVTK